MLINGWSGSGGDAFPFYFKEAGLGPLIGRRTWGGLIGISGTPSFVDGGSGHGADVRACTARDGKWIVEGHGVDPDIEVVDDPTQLAKGDRPAARGGDQGGDDGRSRRRRRRWRRRRTRSGSRRDRRSVSS